MSSGPKKWTGRAVTNARRMVLDRDGYVCSLRYPGCHVPAPVDPDDDRARLLVVDHRLPRSTHPELTWDPANMRPACRWCNGHKLDGTDRQGRARAARALRAGGPARGAKKSQAGRPPRPRSGAARRTSVPGPGPVLDVAGRQPPAPPPVVSLPKGRRRARGGPSSADRAGPWPGDPDGYGHAWPRLRTTPLPDDHGRELVEDFAAFVVDELDGELFPWQLVAAGDLLAVDLSTRRLFYRDALVSVARQNGKTWLMRYLVTWWLVRVPAMHAAAGRPAPQTVVHVSASLRQALDVWEWVADRVETRWPGLVRRVRRGSGKELVELVDGSRYLPLAGSGAARALHGWSVDLALVDEVWAAGDELDGALKPTMRARPDALRLMVSTAGDESAAFMLRWRAGRVAEAEAGERTRALLMEWSPPDGVHGSDAWPWANPSLGRTITADVLADDAATMSSDDYLRTVENRWVGAGVAGWVRESVWELCARDELPPVDGPVWVAVEAARVRTDDDEPVYGLVEAWRAGPELVAVRAQQITGESALWAALGAPVDGRTVLLPPGVFARYPHPDAARLDLVRRVGSRELRASSDEVRWWLSEGRVVHEHDVELAEHVTTAKRVVPADTGGADLYPPKRDGSVHLARALVWSVAEAVRAPVELPRPVLRLS